MITFLIDEFCSCLFDVKQNGYVSTEVVPITSKGFLKGYNSRTGWYVNWCRFSKEVRIFAVVDKNIPDEIQGLVAVSDDKDAKLTHIVWSSVAPHNDVWGHKNVKGWTPKYRGVDGHLLAIAIEESIKMGYEGACYAEAMDRELLINHINHYGVIQTGIPGHPYHFGIHPCVARKIIEEHDYEKSNREFK